MGIIKTGGLERAQLRKEKIITAAVRLFSRKGYEATSIRDIAVEAGVTSSTLYYYMQTKEELLITIMKGGLERLIKNAKDSIGPFSLPEEKLAVLVQVHVITHGVKRLSALVTDTEVRALSGESREIIGKLRDEYESLWNDVLEEGSKEGVFEIEEIKFTRFALLQMCTGVAHWYSPTGPVPIVEISLRFANMALALVRAIRDGKPVTVTDLNLPVPNTYYERISGGNDDY